MAVWRRVAVALTTCGGSRLVRTNTPITHGTYACYPYSIYKTTLCSLLRCHSTRSPSKPQHTSHMTAEAQLDKLVNSLVARRQARRAVRVMQHALATGRVEEDMSCSNSADTPQYTGGDECGTRAVFSWRALAATLYACEACHEERLALQLVQEVRARRVVGDEMWVEERVLAVLLRLQCAVRDMQAARHLFGFLCQHNLLRRRTASTFLCFCCACAERALAFAVYHECQQRHIELSAEDYLRLGRLCVTLCEPRATLHALLRDMQEFIAEVPEEMVRQVLLPWCAQGSCTTTSTSSCTSGAHCDLVHIPSSSSSSSSSSFVQSTAEQAERKKVGVCPRCGGRLAGYPFTPAHRAQLLHDLQQVIAAATSRRTPRAQRGFTHWQRYLAARTAAHDAIDILLDGANIGYYGLSKWYAEAKREVLRRRGVAPHAITAESVDFAAQCKHAEGGARHAVDVNVNFALIDLALRAVQTQLGRRRPLVLLHERHCEAAHLSPRAAALLAQWRANDWVYCTPHGLNDDLCWLYAALTLTPTTTTTNKWASDTTFTHASDCDGDGQACAVWVVTNDLMRDHHFRLLSPRCFTRWRDRCRVSFRCARSAVKDGDREKNDDGDDGGVTTMLLQPPEPFTRCIQEGHDEEEGHHSWHVPYYTTQSTTSGSDARGAGEVRESGGCVAMEEEEGISSQRWVCMRI